LTTEQSRALALLASMPHGIIEDSLLVAYQFDRATIAGLVLEGLATAAREILAASDRTTIDVVRIRISDGGPAGARRLIGPRGRSTWSRKKVAVCPPCNIPTISRRRHCGVHRNA
jgi:hypothetical protein